MFENDFLTDNILIFKTKNNYSKLSDKLKALDSHRIIIRANRNRTSLNDP